MDPVLQALDITKKFGDTLALNAVDFDLFPGEIHGLCGANGSGKSTLLNILNGHTVIGETGGFAGELRINGAKVNFRSPRDSARLGIGMVHQELSLIGDLDVASNIRMGQESGYSITEKLLGTALTLIDEKSTRHEADKILSRMGISMEVRRRVTNLPVNLKQFVEIGREIGRTLKILILDEPTACLGADESGRLLQVLMELKQEGMAIIFVTHRLEELQAVCDRVTVFRDGRKAAVYRNSEIRLADLARDMLGESVISTTRERRNPIETEAPILSLRGFACRDQARSGVQMDLDIYPGEIVGFTGLAGHGHNLLPYGLMNLLPWRGGASFKGEPIRQADTGALIRKGVFFLPDERKELGLLLEGTLEENMVFAARNCLGSFLHPSPIRGLSLLNKKLSRTRTEEMIRTLKIRCTGPGQTVKQLSGGNQQKVCIARALLLKSDLLFVGEPTRGMDIHAKEVILDQLLQMNRAHGTAIVIASGEMDELRRVCDRVVVFYDGKIAGIFQAGTPREELLLALAGEKGEN